MTSTSLLLRAAGLLPSGTARQLASSTIISSEERGMPTSVDAASAISAESYTIERSGEKVIVPKEANLLSVSKMLARAHEAEMQPVDIKMRIERPVWDAAIAVTKAIERVLGPIIQKPTGGGWFSPPEVQRIEVATGLDTSVNVPFGKFLLPGFKDAWIDMSADLMPGGFVGLGVHIQCRQFEEPRARNLLAAVKDIAANESLHRGKAFALAFKLPNGKPNPMPTPRFFRLGDQRPLFNRTLEASIERNILVPMRSHEVLTAAGMSLKRGTLFAGPYGTGKTLLANWLARLAQEFGWTFIYVKDSAELPQALAYAQLYQPVMVFCEDVDRIAGIDRTDEVNMLLNQLDGIDSKGAGVFTVLTTNHDEQINPAMKRPGRIDLLLKVTEPDSETVQRMLRVFTGDRIAADEDLSSVGDLLAGNSPARIHEAAGRAKYEVLRRTGSLEGNITGADLFAVAEEVLMEKDLFLSKPDDGSADVQQQIGRGFEAASRVLLVNGNSHTARAAAANAASNGSSDN